MKSFAELEVTMVIGLCWGESDNKLINSAVSEHFHCSRSVLIKEELLRCRLFACSILDWANAACFVYISIWDGALSVFVRFVRCCNLRLGLPVILFLGSCRFFLVGMPVVFTKFLTEWVGPCWFLVFFSCSSFSFCSTK